ncbi:MULTISPECIES: YybH family protein [unclassified Polaribacter]|uniref:YybH family protein n=1 Tax=unclassified Polaribacter TaxID=196858 RepID=UPI0016746155|nr:MULTISPECIES: nuclear transport factor 2 family protein [unclassified Polaribacter]
MRKTIKLFGLSVCIAFIISSCETAEKEGVYNMEKIRTEIQALEDAYSAAEVAKDADAIMKYYSKEAISYSQNKEPLKGKTAIRESIVSNIANDSIENYNEYKVVDLFVEGSTVVEVGSWIEFDVDGNEKQSGNFIAYFEKRYGKYICVRDMSTTNTPLKLGL